ncbi:hypothetical protein WJX72_006343 [[Myrmecia] bisecta]|uniref:ABC transporter domain-containing protein n=1 Tax=[Myrmecia] bisecta TaxID=41462 RepID=A0AAW1R6S2_9CHLO
MDTAEVTRQGCTSDLQQLKALLWRQQLLKRRSWPNTLVELLSPVFLIFLLVIAYHKVHETHHDARIYVNDTSQVLRNMTDALLTAQETTLASSTNCTAVLAGLNITSSTAQAADASGWAPGLTPAQQQAVQDCLQRGSFASDALPMAVIQALQAFIDTKGPIPIPTLDEFVVLHEAIQLAVGQNTEVLDLLHGAKRSFGWNVLGNLLDLGQLAFAPATPDVLRFAAHMERTHEMFSKVFRGVFATEAEAEDYVLNGGQRVWALVVFNEGPNATVADYTVRMNYTTVPTTSIAVNKWKHGVPVYYKQYLTSGFLSIQAAIDGYVLGQSHLHEASLGPLPVQPSDDPSANSWVEWGAVFPTAAYHHNRFYDAVGPMLGLLMCLCMVFPLSMLVRGVVEEKETRARETMMIMGLRPWVLSTAWALTYGVIFCFVAASVTLTCCLSFLPSTSPGLLFTLLLAFSASELAFGLMVASIFSNAKIAGIVAPLAHFAALMPRYIFFRAEEQQAIGGKAAVSLLGPAAFTFAADLLAQYEGSGSGMGWGDLWADAYSLGALGQSNSDAEQKGEPASHSEEAVVVELHNLRKVYGKHIAVKGLSLKMRNHEITSLLGPNGAGKTSAVGMLSGLLRPSAGDALILGYSVLREPGHARQYLGYCPQQNVQFGQLTVGEHLLLYAAVKRIPGGAFGGPAAAAAQEIMEAVGLAEKKHCYAQALSGGMKRKLQVAIALLGGSKVVLLDEPTSGVDPVSRRALWTVLENAKQDRAMLLTTHYMDEADLLSDQVAIMAEGELQCFGPSLQLKQQYSDGYTLCMTTSLEGQVHREGIQQLITSHVPKATFLRTSGAELVYRLPMGATAAFPDMLEQLDADQPKLGVVHYGLSMPTLEEMFKKRALIASRDKKNMMFTLLLPVVAIAFVLLILRVNINPSAPTMNLTLGSLGQRSPIPIANAPGALSGCISLDGSPHSTDPSCAPGWAFQSVEDVADSYAMSEQLLRGLAAGVPAQYGALVFNDTIVQRMADDSGLSALSSDQLIAQLMPLIVGQLGTLLPGLAGVDSAAAVSGMTLDQQKQAAAAAAALELVMLPEARVLRRMYQRHTQQLPVMLMHNASSYHSLPSLVSDLHATIGALNAAPGGIKPRFNARSHPLPLTEEESVQLDNILLVLAALFVLVPFCYLSGAYCINPVIERTSQALHMQLLSGCPTVIYWLGSYTWDLLMHSFVCLLSLAIFAAYQDDALVGDANRALGTLALLLAYGAAVIPLSYCYSFGFSSPSAAQVAIAGLNFVTGFVFLTASYVMEAIPETRAAQRVLVHICRLMPSFNLGEGFIEMTRLTLELGLVQARTAADTTNSTDSQFTMSGAVANVTAALGVPLQAGSPTQTPTATAAAALAENWQPGSAFDWDVLGRSLTFMCIEAVAFFTLAVALDWSSRHSLADGPLRALLRCWQSALSVLVPAPVARWCRERGFRHRGVAGQGYELAGAAGSLGGNNKETEMAGMAGEAAAPRKLPRGYQVDLGDDDDWAQPASSSIDIHELEASQGVTGGQGVEDADVEVERQRVQQGRADAETICIRNLQKVYGGRPPKVAVHDLCLGVPSGQRFGFLGPNGAGKTTTLSILSGSLLPSSGDALVNGASVIHDRSRAGGLLGYCPQVDPLVDKMTAVEQLAMYARLKGVPEKKINSAVADVVRRVSLPAEMALRCAADYSGGNKRKLALGMALVGSPAAILLDECSSGMDPSARRAMWSFIINATSTPEEQAAGGGAPAGHLAMGGRRTAAVSVVLTTHSMEECEALCTRVGIMHKGRLACVGSPQRLKALYGGGYLLEVLTAEGDAMSHARVKEFVTQQFGGAETGAADGVHQVGRAQYQLRHGGPSLAVVMREVEEVKEALGIRAYSISQPTLEQVFLAVIGERLHGE